MRRHSARFFAICCGLAGLAGCADTPAGPVVAAPVVPVSAQALVGSTPQVLSSDFGPPELRRVDGAAQVWLYRSADCGLQLFLYPDAAGTPRVTAALPDGTNAPGCLQSFSHGVTAVALESPAPS